MIGEICDRHERVVEDLTILKSRTNEIDKSAQALWHKFDMLEAGVKTRELEEEGYRQTTRQHTKDIEGLNGDVDRIKDSLGIIYAKKEDTASKESLKSLTVWVKYGWLTTVFAVLALIANIILMIWGKVT